MAKDIYYRQCKMQKKNMFQTSYIPEEFAKLGKFLKLRDSEGEWDDGWKVIEVSSHRHLDNEVPDSHSAIKNHRKATGDSMPKERK